MASPLKTGKQSVDLGAASPRVSRIRRDPPIAVKQSEIRDPRERERVDALIGILAIGLALAVITLALATNWDWSPTQYTFKVKVEE